MENLGNILHGVLGKWGWDQAFVAACDRASSPCLFLSLGELGPFRVSRDKESTKFHGLQRKLQFIATGRVVRSLEEVIFGM